MNKARLGLTFTLLATLLTSCGQPERIKVTLPYNKYADFIQIEARELYEMVVDVKKSMVVLYSVDGCVGCDGAKRDLKNYAYLKHCDIYWVDFTSITKEDYDYIYRMTLKSGDAFAFPEWGPTMQISLPMMDICAYGGVGFRASSNFVDTLVKFTEVSDPVE